jgi:heterodisulfide reductase subunit B
MAAKGKRRRGQRRAKRSTCGRKIPYRNRHAAEQARKAIISRTGTDPADISAYKCPDCKHWHV